MVQSDSAKNVAFLTLENYSTIVDLHALHDRTRENDLSTNGGESFCLELEHRTETKVLKPLKIHKLLLHKMPFDLTDLSVVAECYFAHKPLTFIHCGSS